MWSLFVSDERERDRPEPRLRGRSERDRQVDGRQVTSVRGN